MEDSTPLVDPVLVAEPTEPNYQHINSKVTGPYWSKPVKKTIYTLNIGDYAPEICALTYPLMQAYARKIGAEFHVIRERKFPDWPLDYEQTANS